MAMDEGMLGVLAVIVVGVVISGLLLATAPAVRIVEPPPEAVVGNPARVILAGLPEGAEVGVRLIDSLGRTLVEKALVFHGGRATGLLYFDLPSTEDGSLEVFSLSRGDSIARRPVRFPRERGLWVKVFLLDRDGKPFPAVRRIPGTPRVATEALRALLAGPTLIEERAGIWTAAPAGTGLRALSISAGVARVTLEVPDPRAPALGLFSAQVRETLLQFPTIAAVEIEYVPR